jgi:hypothetical protein
MKEHSGKLAFAIRRRLVPWFVILSFFATVCRGSEPARAEEPPATQDRASRALQILMVGNSMTYGNNLDELVQRIAQSTGEKVQVRRSAKSGYTLENHAGDRETLADLERQRWDVVVLQEHGLVPTSPRLTATNMIPAARQLMARLGSPRPRVILLMPWGRKDGVTATELQGERVEFKDYATAQEAQRAGCERAARELGVGMAPAGLAWKAMRAKHPDVELYSDIMHGNLNGSYLAALTVYAAIYERSPRGITWHPASIPKATASMIIDVAAETWEQHAAEKGMEATSAGSRPSLPDSRP